MMNESTPLVRRPNTQVKKMAGALVLIVNSIERLAFYGIAANLVLFLNMSPYNWMSYNAATANFIYLGFSNVFCIIGGLLSDSYLGRFKTIVIGFVVYIVGYIFFPLFYPYPYDDGNSIKEPSQYFCPIANHTNGSKSWINISSPETSNTSRQPFGNEHCSSVIVIALMLIAFGIGLVKANIAPFGADQVQMSGKDAQRRFFNWFYWSVNVGSLIAVTVISYVQQDRSFFWGYLIPCILLAFGLILFCIGGAFKVYNIRQPGGSVFSNVFGVIKEACLLCRQSSGRRDQLVNSIIEYHDSEEEEFPTSCLDHAKTRHGGSYHDSEVDDVKKLGKIILVFMSLIPYFIVYFQMETNFLVQGLHMCLSSNCALGSTTNVAIPASLLAVFDVVFIIIFIPIMTKFVYPKLDAMGYPLSLPKRISLGMIFSMMAVLLAGGLETWRLNDIYRNASAPFELSIMSNIIGDDHYNASTLSIFLQIPQYSCIGLGEIFTSIAGLELAYSKAPRSMQSIIMGLFLFSGGIGSFLGSLIMNLCFGHWFFSRDKGNINCRIRTSYDQKSPLYNTLKNSCHLDYYFYFLAGLQFLGLILFIVISKYVGFSVKKPSRNQNRSVATDRDHAS